MKEEHSYLYIIELDVSYSKYVDSVMLIKFNKIYNLRVLFFVIFVIFFIYIHTHVHAHAHTYTLYSFTLFENTI